MWLFFHHSNALHRNMKNWDLFSGPHIGLWPLSPHPYWKGAIKCGENLSPQPIGCIHILTKNLKGLMLLKRTHGNKQKTKSVWSFHIFSLFFLPACFFVRSCSTISSITSVWLSRPLHLHLWEGLCVCTENLWLCFDKIYCIFMNDSSDSPLHFFPSFVLFRFIHLRT